MEVVWVVIASVAGLFAVIFGGRGLVDLLQGMRWRRKSA